MKYVYDNFGRLVEMHTYRSGSNWNSAMWPTGATCPSDITKWLYHEATGLLTAKEYADVNQTTYTYSEGGRLETRTWARTVDGSPLTTTYTYDPDTGELLLIDSSDDTPDISFSYDRLGRYKSVSDAVGSREFIYNDALQLESETVTGLQNYTISRKYETEGVAGRSTGFGLGEAYDVTYGYDDVGRYEDVEWTVGGVSQTATYSYLADSDLIEQLTTPEGLKTSYAYEPKRNLKTRVKNEFCESLISQYDYTYDELGRRTAVLNSGKAFTDPAFNHYDFNDRSELTGSSRYPGNNILDRSNPVSSEYRGNKYDPIGNRIESVEAINTNVYSTNSLNQYTTLTGNAPETLTYDSAGNLISGPSGLSYRYNAENRLIVVEPQSPDEGDVKVEFVYDYLCRRVLKKVSSYMARLWNTSSEIQYIRDGWNVIRERIYAANQDNTDNHYVWGLDLSQSLQGAGGAGGLLATIQTGDANMYYYNYDVNGNVVQLVGALNGDIGARYEFDPYGKTMISIESNHLQNPFRSSTKYYDSEIGAVYYGYRYYSFEMGRWLSRDPIEEKGGLNAYVFLLNDPINGYDSRGLWKEIQGRKDIWRAESGDTLENLASQFGSEEDWVCLWPDKMKSSIDYPAVSPCDEFDVSNLTATGGKFRWGTRIGIPGGFWDYGRVLTWGFIPYFSNDSAYRKIAEDSGEGAHPISHLLVAGHSAKDSIDIFNQTYTVRLSGQGLINWLGLNRQSNIYTRASNKKGPVRCWFTKDASVYGLACNSFGWAENMADWTLREGAIAYGTPDIISISAIRIKIEGGSYHYTMTSLLGDPLWRHYDGQL